MANRRRTKRWPEGYRKHSHHDPSRINGYAAPTASLTGHAVSAGGQPRGGRATSANHYGLTKKRGEEASSGRNIGLSRSLQLVDNANQLLGGMGDGNIVVLAFGTFLSKIRGKGSIPLTDKPRGVKECVTEVT